MVDVPGGPPDPSQVEWSWTGIKEIFTTFIPGGIPIVGLMMIIERWRRNSDRAKVSLEAANTAAEERRLERADAADARVYARMQRDLDVAQRRIEWWERDSRFGWTGAVNAQTLARDIRHDANEMMAALILEAHSLGVTLTKPKMLALVPDLEVLSGRNGKVEIMPS